MEKVIALNIITAEEYLKEQKSATPSPTAVVQTVAQQSTSSQYDTGLIIGIVLMGVIALILLFLLIKYILPTIARYAGYLVHEFMKGVKNR